MGSVKYTVYLLPNLGGVFRRAVSMPKPLNDRVGEFFFYQVLKGNLPKPPDIYLEVKDKNGNPVEIKFKKGTK